MTTIAAIADAALDAVALAITDAVQTVTVTRISQGAYNATTGAYAETESTQTGRAVLDSVRPVEDIFPAYIAGPKDQLWLLEGLASLREGDKLTIGGADSYVKAWQDIGGAGTLYYAVAQ